jgi:hypothetical protein
MPPIGSLERASERDARSGPGEFSISARPVQCPHCGGRQFKAGEAWLNTALATLLDPDWTDMSANALICTTYGQIRRFGDRPERISWARQPVPGSLAVVRESARAIGRALTDKALGRDAHRAAFLVQTEQGRAPALCRRNPR